MATQIYQPELDTILLNSISAYENGDPFCAAILETAYVTGLRMNEILEVNRWTVETELLFKVNLEKGDSIRKIDSAIIPRVLKDYYTVGASNPVYTYSAILWRLNKALPIITVNGDVRRSSAHLFRYNFIKKLHNEGFTPTEIKTIICHKSQGSTNQYIFDNLYLH